MARPVRQNKRHIVFNGPSGKTSLNAGCGPFFCTPFTQSGGTRRGEPNEPCRVCPGEWAEAVVLEAQDGGLGRFGAGGALVASGGTGHTSEA
jgi:hypothetical protein